MKEPGVARMFAIWGAAIALAAILMFETRGAILRTPLALVSIAVLVGYTVFKGAKRAKLDAPVEDVPTVNRILRIVREHKGRVTAAEVLAETNLGIEEVRKTLDELTYAGACQLVVSDKGMQVYYFPEFEDETSKERDELSRKAQAQSTKQ